MSTASTDWMQAVKPHQAALEPFAARAVEAGADPRTVSYMTHVAAMQRMVFDQNNRRSGATTAYASFEEFVLKHGEVFQAPPENKPRPKGFRKGRDKLCFMNSVRAMFEHEDEGWQYVEGFGVAFIPTHHAWVLDPDGQVVETTWKTSGNTYFGVKFSEEEWRLTMRLTGVYGVFNEVLLEAPYTPESYVARLRTALAEKRKPRVYA